MILPFYSLYEWLRIKGCPPLWLISVLSFELVNLPKSVLVWRGWRFNAVSATVMSAPTLGCVLLLGTLAWVHMSETARCVPQKRADDGVSVGRIAI
jgi:hypothetical protein